MFWHIISGIKGMDGSRYIDLPEHEQQRRRLVNALRDKGITDEKVLEAIYSVPRHFFMREDLRDLAYEDHAFPIDEGQTISQPFTVAYQTQLLNVSPRERILEIGTGSGYQAVILAFLAAEVFSIERQKRLYEKNKNFEFLHEFKNLYLFYGDGYEGLRAYAPFDKILITAAAPFVPPKLLEQLNVGGKMVLPLGKDKPQKMVRITKLGEDEFEKENFSDFSFVPMLTGKQE